jgi:hypothetical protein
MSRVHDAMRSLEHKSTPEKGSVAAPTNLVGALIGELADELPDDASLEAVRADLIAASRAYEHDKKKDLALRFYLAMRSLLRAHEMLQERLKKAEKRGRGGESSENPHLVPQGHEEGVHELERVVEAVPDLAMGQHG